MPNYIDKDKLIRDLIDNRNFYPAIVKRAIENAPTEDVVPKFEVDKALQLGIDIGEQEAAERIFEEIKVMSIDFTKKSQQFEFGYRFAIQEILAELQKKYIGE